MFQPHILLYYPSSRIRHFSMEPLIPFFLPFNRGMIYKELDAKILMFNEFSSYIHPCNYYHKQDIENFYHLRKFTCVSFYPVLLPSPNQEDFFFFKLLLP